MLVVDDDPAAAEVAGVLTRSGCRVRLSATAEEALAAAAHGALDLVILEPGLPGIGGVELVRRLRAAGDVQIIVLSAEHDVAQKVLALDAGADDNLVKPVGATELAARVRARLRSCSLAAAPAPVVASAASRDAVLRKPEGHPMLGAMTARSTTCILQNYIDCSLMLGSADLAGCAWAEHLYPPAYVGACTPDHAGSAAWGCESDGAAGGLEGTVVYLVQDCLGGTTVTLRWRDPGRRREWLPPDLRRAAGAKVARAPVGRAGR